MRELAFVRKRSVRGAALILEIVIYLVIVGLIAMVAVRSVGPLRNLVFMSHAKGDVKNVQYWVEQRYAQDSQYPDQVVPNTDEIRLTMSNGTQNSGVVKRSTSGSAWCILVVSSTITDPARTRFWMSSNDINSIVQSKTADPSWVPPSGVPDLQCPSSVS